MDAITDTASSVCNVILIDTIARYYNSKGNTSNRILCIKYIECGYFDNFVLIRTVIGSLFSNIFDIGINDYEITLSTIY